MFSHYFSPSFFFSLQLFDFDQEVKPILEVLIGKTVEQAMMEVMEEDELASLRKHQVCFFKKKNALIHFFTLFFIHFIHFILFHFYFVHSANLRSCATQSLLKCSDAKRLHVGHGRRRSGESSRHSRCWHRRKKPRRRLQHERLRRRTWQSWCRPCLTRSAMAATFTISRREVGLFFVVVFVFVFVLFCFTREDFTKKNFFSSSYLARLQKWKVSLCRG